ncbi:MAG: dihydropteroate synthase [Anaerolineales bacterium]|jgi:5-methyltetrahydrofolate--homocysteine methyltransferase
MTTDLQGTGDPITLDPSGPSRIIGERINPSGRSRLLQALLDRNWEYAAGEARRQVEAGADVVDVNVGGKGVDEEKALPEVVRAVGEAVRVPLSVDTRLPTALEAALAICPGRPLVNSIGGEKKILAENLPIVAEHGVPVIALCMGAEGIPSSAEGRLRVAHQVLEAAVRAGIKEENVLFDPLVLTVGADDQAARIVLETIRRLREEFPQNSITGGASNVSFGMPARSLLNASFLTAASLLGMNIPITDPTKPELRFALRTADIFLGRDRKSRRYMQFYREEGARLQPGGRPEAGG